MEYTTRKRMVEVEVEVKIERPASILVTDGDTEAWIPKSLIGETSEVQGESDSGMLLIPEWKAKDAGLI